MKTVLITGANKGIGFETVKQMAELGYQVYLGSRDEIKGLEAINKLKELGILNVELLKIDVTNIDSIKKAKEELEMKIDSLDVLINNAAITGDIPQNPSAVKIENIKKVFDTNFFGVIQTTQQFLSLLHKSNEPRIVNVTSDLGSLTKQSDANWEHHAIKPTAYVASKVALNAYTVVLAYELKESNFKVNCVNPGYTATDLNNNMGKRTPDFSAKIIVKCATFENDGPSGKFFSEEGELPW